MDLGEGGTGRWIKTPYPSDKKNLQTSGEKAEGNLGQKKERDPLLRRREGTHTGKAVSEKIRTRQKKA